MTNLEYLMSLDAPALARALTVRVPDTKKYVSPDGVVFGWRQDINELTAREYAAKHAERWLRREHRNDAKGSKLPVVFKPFDLTYAGNNENIRGDVRDDETMVSLGFEDWGNSWFYSTALIDRPGRRVKFYVVISKATHDIKLFVYDEDFDQRYDYQHMLMCGNAPDEVYEIWDKVEEQMEMLTAAGVVYGHEYGEYI